MDTKAIKFTTNVIWNVFGNLAYMLCQWLITIVIVKLTNYNNAGIFSLAMSVTNVFICIALFGVRNYQVSDIEKKYSDSIYLKTRIVTCCIASILCIIIVLISNYDIYQILCILFYMGFRLSEAFVDVLHGINQNIWRVDLIGKSFVLRGVVSLAVFSLTLWKTNNLCFSILIMMIISFLCVVFFDYKKTSSLTMFDLNVSNNLVYKLLLECLPLAVYSLLTTTIATIPRIFLENKMGKEVLGIYASIATPATIIQAISSYIFVPFATIFSEYYSLGQIRKFIYLFLKCILLFSIASLLFFICAIFGGEYLYNRLYGKSILTYMYLLKPVIWCTILTAFVWFLCMILTVIRELKGLLVSSLLTIIICLIISPIMIDIFKENGTSYSLIISFCIQIVILFIYLIRNILKNKINKYL